MARLRTRSAILLVAASIARACSGQGLGAGEPSAAAGVRNPIMILNAPAVQEELKLDDAQKERVYEVTKAMSTRAREILQAAQSPAVTPQDWIQAFAQLRQENTKAVEKLLKPAQKDRYEEIVLRMEGPLAVGRPEVASKVNLSPNQRQGVQRVMMQYLVVQKQLTLSANVQGLMTGPGRDRLKANADGLRDEAEAQIAKILSRKQKDAFNALLGEPFDLAKIDPELASRQPPKGAENPDQPEPAPKKKKGR